MELLEYVMYDPHAHKKNGLLLNHSEWSPAEVAQKTTDPARVHVP